MADNFPVRWQTIFPSLGSHFSRQGQAKSLVLFLGGAGESAVVAYMKVARRRAAVRMHPLTGPGGQAGQWLGFFIDCGGQLIPQNPESPNPLNFFIDCAGQLE